MSLPIPDNLPDSPFLENTTIQYAWDSTSLGEFLSCPRRYQLHLIEGWLPKAPGFAIALRFGIAFHTAMEVYEKHKAKGNSHDESVHHTVSYLANEDEDYQSLPTSDDVDEEKAETPDDDDGITYRNTKIRTRYHLMRAVVWYLEHYSADPAKTIILSSGTPAVEVSFRVPLPNPGVNNTELILCGHQDRMVEYNGEYWGTDYKTTKSLSRQFFANFQLSHQMSGYTYGGQIILDKPVRGMIIDGIALLVGGAKFQRAFSMRTKTQLQEYVQTVSYVFDQAVRLAETGGDYPMNTAACYFCHYKDICSQPPEYRQRYLEMLFYKGKAWNPLANR